MRAQVASITVMVLLLAVVPSTARAEWFCTPPPEPRESLPPPFATLDDNYFITGIPSEPEVSTKQVKFQFSFKFDLIPNHGRCGLFFGYTQLSLWNMWDVSGSSPFEDTLYNPQLFLTYGNKNVSTTRNLPEMDRFRFLWVRFGADHQSNGQAGAASRGWTRILGSARFDYWWQWWLQTFYVTLEPKAWIPFVESRSSDGGGNPDLIDYVGYGELRTELGWQWILRDGTWQELNLQLLLRKGTVGSRGTAEVTLRYRPPFRYTIVAFYAQAFFGYDETLLHYNQRATIWRLGIAFDDRFEWTRGDHPDDQRPPPPP